ncbi:DUF1839 family protein [Pinisolibacter aquiterrae]|uniref:DUF1839 family protein n=1 Tax=Pinisolibacter aquiterrae TaxID=2815579 RepID=UPI001C3D572F|nr:DUF1839 family protein [Pinisolibacter aquiterrae]MBV5263035.1 DUF1839 family protein [Pinisolibacter aquiterrae]MCC8233951.1 DUF1839 family protein [Pinisolibacter aquiterrae]
MLALDPSTHRSHVLHASDRRWPQTNCWTDLWIEIVAALGHDPHAMLGFTVMQDYEGDQATFFKVPTEDMERLWGLRLLELSIFDRLEAHVVEQAARGRIVVVEVDGHYLPDTLGVSYRTTHPKTTIGITRIDPEARRLDYFHNDGFFSLDGEDYDGIFGRRGEPVDPTRLLPYAEFLKIPDRAPPRDLRRETVALLRRHLDRRPATNPFAAWAADFPRHAADLATRPPEWFHTYAFNLPRQYGANFELLASHLRWLEAKGETGLEPAAIEAEAIAETAKVFQFKLARAMARRKFDGLVEMIETMAASWERIMADLDAKYRDEPIRDAA